MLNSHLTPNSPGLNDFMEMSEIQQAKRWFIERFLHSTPSRTFALRSHGLEDMTRAEAQKMSKVRQRNARYDFKFIPTRHRLVIEPNTDEAAWCRGVIWYDPEQGEFTYQSREHVDLYTDLDRP